MQEFEVLLISIDWECPNRVRAIVPASFQRLLVEGVEPALIIADFLEEKRVREDCWRF
jgi:hypothetical protein